MSWLMILQVLIGDLLNFLAIAFPKRTRYEVLLRLAERAADESENKLDDDAVAALRKNFDEYMGESQSESK